MTYGGVFDSLEPEPGTEPYGEITLEFSTCNAGTVTYDIPSFDRQGVILIKRAWFLPPRSIIYSDLAFRYWPYQSIILSSRSCL